MSDGFEGYDVHKCSAPDGEHPDPPDPHDDCEREIVELRSTLDELETELAAAQPPLTYAELFAAVAARIPARSPFSVEVRTWLWRDLDGLGAVPETSWRIGWFDRADENGKHSSKGVDGATAREALQKLYEAVPLVDATGVGGLVGDGKVTP
jgi:hypothetical protein